MANEEQTCVGDMLVLSESGSINRMGGNCSRKGVNGDTDTVDVCDSSFVFVMFRLVNIAKYMMRSSDDRRL